MGKGDDASTSSSSDPAFIAQKRRQIFVALTASIGTFCLGNVLGWTSPALPNLKESSDFDNEDPKIPWIASTAFLGALCSCLTVGYLMNSFGRKLAMIIVAVPFIIGWILMALSQSTGSLFLLLIGRFITGYCGAAFLIFVPLYVGETAHSKIRGALTTLMILLLTIGILFTFAVGAYVSYAILSLISAIFPILLLVLLPFIPETPRFYVSKKKPYRALMALKWLRGAQNEEQVRPELEQIQEAYQIDAEDSAHFSDLFVLSSLKPTIISLLLIFFQQMSGSNIVSLFTNDVFESAGTKLDPNLASVIIAACQVATVFIPTFCVDRFGRKVLLIVSEVIMILSLSALGFYFHNKEQSEGEMDGLSWLPLPAFIIFIIGYNVGLGPLVWLVISEILPSQSRALATSLVTSFYWVVVFTSARTFEPLRDALGWTLSYALFALICTLGALFIFFILPETKGKSSEEIELFFKRASTVRRVTLRNSLQMQNNRNGGVTNSTFVADDRV